MRKSSYITPEWVEAQEELFRSLRAHANALMFTNRVYSCALLYLVVLAAAYAPTLAGLPVVLAAPYVLWRGRKLGRIVKLRLAQSDAAIDTATLAERQVRIQREEGTFQPPPPRQWPPHTLDMGEDGSTRP